MTRWKGLPAYPNPCWPVASSRKLRAVLGTLSSKSWKTIRPEGFESMEMSNLSSAWIGFAKKQRGFYDTHEYIRPRKDNDEVLLLSIVVEQMQQREWGTSFYQPKPRSWNDARSWPFFREGGLKFKISTESKSQKLRKGSSCVTRMSRANSGNVWTANGTHAQ